MLMMENQKQQIRTKKYKNTVPTRTIYYEYCKRCRKNKKKPVSERQFSTIIKKFNTKVKDRVFYNNIPLRLPKINMLLQVLKHKSDPIRNNGEINPKSFSVDWKATRQFWLNNPELKNKKYIYHLNDHTDGYIYRVTLKRRLPFFKHSQFYSFVTCRTLRRELSEILKNPYNKIDYYES